MRKALFSLLSYYFSLLLKVKASLPEKVEMPILFLVHTRGDKKLGSWTGLLENTDLLFYTLVSDSILYISEAEATKHKDLQTKLFGRKCPFLKQTPNRMPSYFVDISRSYLEPEHLKFRMPWVGIDLFPFSTLDLAFFLLLYYIH